MFWLESQSWLQSFLKPASLLTHKPPGHVSGQGVPCTPRMLFRYVSSFEDSKLGCSFGDFCSTSYQQIPARMHQWKKVKALVTQSCPTLCNSMDCSPPGSSVHGILQARILEWAAILFSRRSSPPRDQTPVSCIGRQILYLLSLQESMCQQRCKRVGVVGGSQATPEEAVSGCTFPHHSVGSSVSLSCVGAQKQGWFDTWVHTCDSENTGFHYSSVYLSKGLWESTDYINVWNRQLGMTFPNTVLNCFDAL